MKLMNVDSIHNLVEKFYSLAIRKMDEEGESFSLLDTSNSIKKYVNNGHYAHYSNYDSFQGLFIKSHYKTPIGVYCYPLDSKIYESVINGTIPFASDRSFIYILKSKADKVLDVQNYSKDDLLADLSTLGQDYASFDFSGAKVKSPAGELWHFLLKTSTSVNNWNLLLRKLGYGQVLDRGAGVIHHNEPYQSFFLGMKDFDIVDRLNNTTMQSERGGNYDQQRKEYGLRNKLEIYWTKFLREEKFSNRSADGMKQLINTLPEDMATKTLYVITSIINSGKVDNISDINFCINWFTAYPSSEVLEKLVEYIERSSLTSTLYLEMAKNKHASEDFIEQLIPLMKYAVFSKLGDNFTYDVLKIMFHENIDKFLNVVSIKQLNTYIENPKNFYEILTYKLKTDSIYTMHNQMPADKYIRQKLITGYEQSTSKQFIRV